ncbi:high-potential iron-sulfur protein [Noviherbaspirillum sp. UKPF54]|uniref:high-potential iron-sulfur protein n=1 Tax=Noviherbaspirillum sp. UKPF54 TaxID=2601898 RepID=UPI00143CDBB9|nr:high-potential iron-sulfur protein [Noviherbaspirillum sp. UKPF54]
MDKLQKERRRMLARGMIMLAGIPVLTLSHAALAGKASKSDFHYQDLPNEGKRCMDCAEFLPAQAANSAGACRIVDGVISPNGWCMAFTKK